MIAYSSDMNLGRLIFRLEQEDPDRVLPFGFRNPHSFRGYYDQLAFEPARDIRIGDVLDAAKSALGETFTGYKGGEYTMTGHSECWISNYGESSDNLIGPVLLELLLAQEPYLEPTTGPTTSGEAGERSDTQNASDLGGDR